MNNNILSIFSEVSLGDIAEMMSWADQNNLKMWVLIDQNGERWVAFVLRPDGVMFYCTNVAYKMSVHYELICAEDHNFPRVEWYRDEWKSLKSAGWKEVEVKDLKQ